MSRLPAAALMVVLWISISSAAPAVSELGPPLLQSGRYGAYVANTYFDPASNNKDVYFEILRSNKLIYRRQATGNGGKFVIGTLYDDDSDAKLVTMGRDITGDGQPDLVISQWSGGANCCLTFHIFEIGQRFRILGQVDAEFGDQGPHFVHLDNRPGLQIQVYDWTFANWHADFADSPAPRVILVYDGRGYGISTALMRAPVDKEELGKRMAKIKAETKNVPATSWPKADISPRLWGTMLDLIYTGHRILAWQFLDLMWPKNVGGKDDFFNDFVAQMKKSPYWDAVRQMGS
jgi:hypothetical protein